MPKPPKDYSQNVSVKVDNSLSIEWLMDIHAQFELSGDQLTFAHEVRAAHMLFIAAKEAAVTAKAHQLHFDRLARDPKTYLSKLSHQHRRWLKEAGWSGNAEDVINYIKDARKRIPDEQSQINWRFFGKPLARIWLKYCGKAVPFESLDQRKYENVTYTGFPNYIKVILEKAGRRRFVSAVSLRSFIAQIWPKE